ncbi:MAG: hypothetical protein BroJett018_32700 [Chloroflexota bacterium]|nr:CRISPR system precrRNA processing endoribonuclease RAMP protein Cas6 [Chloroflexota bacterium]NOG62331.1 CRISPR system precrRNA processing endoribonuclease RAMP protein Cas6 [Chloroflexota bacterium]GIK65476.1 MAG: hypothetical protein BroJett018_32700 [Chloroflexota bacterium]
MDKSVYAIVVKLVAGGAMPANPSSGRLVHAAFLDIIHQINPSLAKAFHDLNERKLFTVSPLWAERGFVRLGDVAFVRFAFLDPALAHLFVEQFLLAPHHHTLRIGPAPFAITEVYATSTSHERAGKMVLELPSENECFEQARFEFLTPTAFSRKRGAKAEYLTDFSPIDVWKHIRRVWGRITSEDPGPVFDEWCADHTQVIHQSTRRVQLDFGGYFVPGVMGSFTYRLSDYTPGEILHRWWCGLAQFAPYVSVGYKATMGMGQCAVQVK